MKRLFVAIKVPTGKELLGIHQKMKTSLDQEKIKWVDPENIHITLKFLGETPEDKIPAIIQNIRTASENFHSFEITLKSIGIFGSSYKPRVIWIGIKKNDILGDLANTILDAFDRLGYLRDRQNFIPHLTLGRIKHIRDKNYLQQVTEPYKNIEIQKFTVNSIILFESLLKPEGPVYRVIEKVSLERN